MMDKQKTKPKLIFWYSIFWILLFVALYIAYFIYFPYSESTKSKWVLLFSSSVALMAFACKYLEISFYKFNSEMKKNEAEDLKKINSTFYRYKNAVFAVFSIMLYSVFYKYVNTLFIICSITGAFLFLFASKIASKLSYLTSLKAKDASEKMQNIALRLKFNSECASSLVFWGLTSAGIVILYHIFKDYEILSGYIFGVTFASFFENIICTISRNSIEKTNDVLKRIKDDSLKKIKDIFEFYNYSAFFEVYIIALGAAIITGANTLAIMGAFLPLIICANSMFLSIIALLLSKTSRTTDDSKLRLKAVLFVGILSNVMLYFEINNWLNSDFITLVYSSLIGTIAGIITLYSNNLNTINSKLHKLKDSYLKYFMNLSIPLLVLFLVFVLADGINSVLYSYYAITIAVLGYNSTVAIASLINQDKKFNNNAKSYINISAILSFISSVIAFGWMINISEADMLNPIVLFGIILGVLIVFIVLNRVYSAIIKQSKRLALATKSQIRNDKLDLANLTKRSVYQSSSCAMVLALGILVLSYFIFKDEGADIIFALFVGIFISGILPLLKKDDIISPVISSLIRFISGILICVSILFV